MTNLHSYSSLEAALSQNLYSTLFLDAYGVFWAGNAQGAFPGAQLVMERLFSSGKKICIVSNSTQISQNETKKYAANGIIQGKHFHCLTTSGDVAKKLFSSDGLPFPTPNKKYILFCPPHPQYGDPSSLFDTSPFKETADPLEADFIYINIPCICGEDQEEKEVFRERVRGFLCSRKPMVCANPDCYVHEGSPPRLVVRQGSIAALYEEMGGQIFYVGKPYLAVYSFAFDRINLLYPTPKEAILMVGDQPETDIRGAFRFGLTSALITKTGVMGERIAQHGEKALRRLPPTDIPHFLIERFVSDDNKESSSKYKCSLCTS